MKNTSTWQIHIEGQVQGVGFRPFVFQLAKEWQLKGWVNNSADGVHIEFNASENTAQLFLQQVISRAPHLAVITQYSMVRKTRVTHLNFTIQTSSSTMAPAMMMAPDVAMCAVCREEILDHTNRRYQYAFTTCTQCGPRYSIMEHLPYDRENTSMKNFIMCNKCNHEYHDPDNRRHFSQTNSCPECPVVMSLHEHHQLVDDHQSTIISNICRLWEEGKIIAIKGMGGYLLTCDASNASAICELRKRKYRPSKPFAVLFPDLKTLEKEVILHPAAISELLHETAPIVLLPVLEKDSSALVKNNIAPALSTIGVMLPYTPFFHLLMKRFSKPVVATSANISHAPIVFQENLQHELNTIADYVLVHDRNIIAPQDDSVVSFSRHFKQKIIVRRARGYAPLFPLRIFSLHGITAVAMGALLKSTFTLLHRNNIHVSQYLGNMDNYDAQVRFTYLLHHYLELFQTRPEVILVDLHPGYFTTQEGIELSKFFNCPVVSIQHHEAHFAAILGEHELQSTMEPVLGVIWDGTGLGTDHQVWGGEFFSYHHETMKRIAHFDTFDYLLGDKMSMEPRLSAFSLCQGITSGRSLVKPKFSPREWMNYHKILASNQLKTSSVGRIFDAVASLLGLADILHHEGEAALLLEDQASVFFKKGMDIPLEWMMELQPEVALSSRLLINEVISKIISGCNAAEIAAWFHVRLVMVIASMALLHGTHKICFSGGVFQNGVLADLCIKILGKQYQLYFHNQLSPNDENISFGQLTRYCMLKSEGLNK